MKESIDLKRLRNIIELCCKYNVSSMELGDLKVKFRHQEKNAENVIKDTDKNYRKSDEDRLEELDQLLLTNPEEYFRVESYRGALDAEEEDSI